MNSRFIFVLAVLTLTLDYNAMTLVRKNIFELAPTLHDVLFQNNSVFDIIVRSQLDCMTSCSLSMNGCFLVTLYDDMRCRGHNFLHSNPAAGTPTSGARTYIADEKLNETCSQDTDCANTITNNNLLCYEGLCLCVPGYYYSVSTRQCVLGCAEKDLQTSFVQYPDHVIYMYNYASFWNINLEATCLNRCVTNYTNCLHAEYLASGKLCNLGNVTVLDVPASAWINYTGAVYAQRKCA